MEMPTRQQSAGTNRRSHDEVEELPGARTALPAGTNQGEHAASAGEKRGRDEWEVSAAAVSGSEEVTLVDGGSGVGVGASGAAGGGGAQAGRTDAPFTLGRSAEESESKGEEEQDEDDDEGGVPRPILLDANAARALVDPASQVALADGAEPRDFAVDGPPRAGMEYALAVDKLSTLPGVLAPQSTSLSDVVKKLRSKGAWVRVSGPRQSGKTTTARWLRDALEGARSRAADWKIRVEMVAFEAMPISSYSFGGAPAVATKLMDTTPWEVVDKSILNCILNKVIKPHAREREEGYEGLLESGRALSRSPADDDVGTRTANFLDLWAAAERSRKKDLVLIMDEMDALPVNHLAAFLHVLRDLYLREDKYKERVGMWGAVLVTHLPLASLSHAVKDAAGNTEMERVDESPINTFNVAYTPPFFPPLAVQALLLTHQDQTGQRFEEGVVDAVVGQSGGHPWLVNTILGMVTVAAATGSRAVTVGDVLDAVSALRGTSDLNLPLQKLRDRVADVRVQHAVAHILDPDHTTALPHAPTDDDRKRALVFTEALGLIRVVGGEARFTCPLYASILAAELCRLVGVVGATPAREFVTASGYVNITALVKKFGQTGRAAVARLLAVPGDWRDHDGIAECTIQVLFWTFLVAALPPWAYATPEARSGRGASDILVVCKPLLRKEQRAVVEIKFWRRSTKGSMLAIRRAAYQVAFDGFRLSATERHVLIVDAQDTFWAGTFRGSREIWTTGLAEGLRMGLVVSLPELPGELSVTVHGFGWTGGAHSAHGMAAALAGESTVRATPAAAIVVAAAPSSGAALSAALSAAAAAAAPGASETGGVGEGEWEEFDEVTEDTPAQAAVDNLKELGGARQVRLETTRNYRTTLQRTTPSSKPPSPSREDSPAGTPDRAHAQPAKRARKE